MAVVCPAVNRHTQHMYFRKIPSKVLGVIFFCVFLFKGIKLCKCPCIAEINQLCNSVYICVCVFVFSFYIVKGVCN